jgi:hypothetical protein
MEVLLTNKQNNEQQGYVQSQSMDMRWRSELVRVFACLAKYQNSRIDKSMAIVY